MGSQKEAEMDLKHVQSRAALLRRAHELEGEKVPGFDTLAASLRRRAEEMEGGAPGADADGRDLPEGYEVEVLPLARTDGFPEGLTLRVIRRVDP